MVTERENFVTFWRECELEREEGLLKIIGAQSMYQDHNNYSRVRRRPWKERLFFARVKAVFCMILFAFAVVICVKVAQQIKAGSQIEAHEQDPQQAAAPQANVSKTTTTTSTTAATEPPKNESSSEKKKEEHKMEVIDGITYVDGIMIANKSYPLPESYDPGLLPETEKAFNKMAEAAAQDGIYLFISSGYRSHFTQAQIYQEYVERDGKKAADTYSSRAGYSEHQTGYTIDVNDPSDAFRGTPEAKWLAEHCSDYGFIIRYPEGKEDKTGYEYEPWHIRYLGKKLAKKVEASGLCLEEYLGIDSEYKDK